MDELTTTIKQYILDQFLNGEDADALTASTSLVTAGILDSLAVLQLVEFLEQQYGVDIRPDEMTVEHFDTIQDIAELVQSKS
jgi:acyl carrier protein